LEDYSSQDGGDGSNFKSGQAMELDDVLDGALSLQLSHAGGEFEDIVADALKESTRVSIPSFEKHLFHIFVITASALNVKTNMDGIVTAYMAWAEQMGDDAMEKRPELRQTDHIASAIKLHVMDIF
ncbi:hypothetical protein C0992_013077, partial [Termitomyces sp. T32_za158]